MDIAPIDPDAQGALQDVLMEPPLRITYLAGTGATLVISLAGAGRTDFQKPVNEFYKLAQSGGENHVLFVIDDSRSWMNGPNVAEHICGCIEAVVARAGITKVVALGNSMGGTMALILPRLTRIDVVIALTPQVSVDPDIVPEEDRWMKFRQNIETYRFRQIEDLGTDGAQTTIIHGDSEDELVHALRFPQTGGAAHFIVPGGDHTLAQKLHNSGDLAPIIQHAIAGRTRRVRQSVRAAGGMLFADFKQKQG